MKTEIMETEQINFRRIEEAIGYIKDNFKQQPTLDEIAEKIHLSSFSLSKNIY